MRGADNRPTVGWITSDKIKLYFDGKNAKDASTWIRQEKVKPLLSIEKVQEMMTAYGRDLNREIDVLRECIADIANNMEAADDSYMSGFIEDLRKVVE